MAKLVVFRGDAVANEVRLTGRPLRIGRHTTNDVVLDDAANGVSRFHAELQSEGGRYFVVDQKSRNGVWMNGRRINGRTPLAMGVPVTIGGFELILEDDLASSDVDPLPPYVPDMPTVVVTPPPAARAKASTGSTSVARTRPSIDRRQLIMYSSAVAAVLLVGVVTFAVVRSKTGPPPPTTQISSVEPAPVTPPPVDIPIQPPTDPQEELSRQIADAQAQFDSGNLDDALQMLAPVLEKDPDNVSAGELKRRVEAAKAAKQRGPTVAPPPAETVVETPGIPRKTGESKAEYEARARRVQIAIADGHAAFDKADYVTALNRFHAAERDQPGYAGLDAAIAEAEGKQKQTVQNDIRDGLANEQAGKFREARLFYLHALRVDPTSAEARDKAAAMKERTARDAQQLMVKASTAEKIGDKAMANGLYQQVIDLMLEGDQERQTAVAKVEALKR